MKLTRRTRLTAVFLAIGVVSLASAEDNVWVSHGPRGVGSVRGFAIRDGVVFAATANGVFRSRDRAQSWEAAGLQGQSIGSVATASGASVILAVSLSRDSQTGILYASRDGGDTWTAVSDLPAVTAGVDPWHPATAYAGTPDGSIWISTDSAASWSRLPSSPTNHASGRFAMDSRAVYVESYDDSSGYGVFGSSDGGATWIRLSAPIYPYAVAAGSARGVVYVAGRNGVCRSSDFADTWACSRFPGTAARVLELPAEGGRGVRILASAQAGLYRSDDGGATWSFTALTVPSGIYATLATDPAGSLVLAGTDTGIQRSLDRADTWTSAASGLSACSVFSLGIDPSSPSTIWANLAIGGAPSLFRSVDDGFTWSPAGGPDTPAGSAAFAIDPQNPSRLYIASQAVDRSDDGGATWMAGVSTPGTFIHSLVIDPGDSDRVWVGTSAGLYRSDDGARTWKRPAAVAQEVYSILFDSRKPGRIYAGSFFDADAGYYGYPEGGSIFVSLDRGTNFTKNQHDFGAPVTSLATDPFDDAILYVGTGAGVHRTLDGGLSWQPPRTDPAAGPALGRVGSLVADPIRVGRLYAATDAGVFRTTDRGQTWAVFGAGLGSLLPSSLEVSPDGRWLHAATLGGGVFELDLQNTYPCTPGATRLCLLDGRYAVDVAQIASDDGVPVAARALNDRSGYFVFGAGGADAIPAVAVKMLPDGAFGHPGAPFFYASLTDNQYALTVTDTVTGATLRLTSRSDAPLCGGTARLSDADAAPGAWDYLRHRSEGGVRLMAGRFSVTLEARHPRSGTVADGAVMTSADRFAIFSLPAVTGDPEFPEVVVAMDEAAGAFSLIHSGMTSLAYTLKVTDSVTGAVRSYTNDAPFCGQSDPNAFPE